MNAIMLPSSRKPHQLPKDDLPMTFAAPANDDRLTRRGAIFGAEEMLNVCFEGLSPEQQRRALASFPGASRCRLAAD